MIIPEGTFNFVDVGEPITEIVIPAGINLFGAPTQRTRGFPVPSRGMNPNDQVVDWKTELVLPWDVPGNDTVGIPTWLHFIGEQDPTRPSRISDIKFTGYREIDPTSTQMTRPVAFSAVIDFRADHLFLKNVGAGIDASGRVYWPNGMVVLNNICGVIDHCRLVNDVGIPTPFPERTVGYGVGVTRTGREYVWEPDISKVLGKYTNYTVIVEDSYFSKWRHGVSSNHGAHWVFRHNTIEYDFGQGSLDAHETSILVGTRAVEVYNNAFLNRDDPFGEWTGRAIQIRGGGGVFFNNYEDGSYRRFLTLTSGGSGPDYTWVKDIWIWNNESNAPTYLERWSAPGVPLNEGEEYFLHEPHTFPYSPYPYPFTAPPPPTQHVLQVNSEPRPTGFTVTGPMGTIQGVTPQSFTLDEGAYTLEAPTQFEDIGKTYRFVQWTDGYYNPISDSPVIILNLTADTSLRIIYEDVTPPPPAKGILQINAFIDSVEVVADGLIVETEQTFQTPKTLELEPGLYTVDLTYESITKTYTADVVEGLTTTINGQLAPPTPQLQGLQWALLQICSGVALVYISSKAKPLFRG